MRWGTFHLGFGALAFPARHQQHVHPQSSFGQGLAGRLGSLVFAGSFSHTTPAHPLGLSAQEAMIKEWEPVVMEFKPWGSTGTYIVAGGSIDEVQTLLDDPLFKANRPFDLLVFPAWVPIFSHGPKR